ncbi:MAG: hypothetical protein JWN69_2325 [Alphaproteobacteria bacterium]|nr:hypothetical protein [Alphaproteobacteria bacterium]
MARICAALCTSHSPYLYASPDDWEPARARRAAAGGIAKEVPVDSVQQNHEKFERCMTALAVLRNQLEAARPDVLIMFGDDQSEQFGFDNYPAFAVYAGADFSGFKVSGKFGLPVPGVAREDRPRTEEHWATVPGAPAFARHLIVELVKHDFDPAFSLELPRKEAGIGHAFMRPLVHLVPRFDIPTVPVFVNCYYGPQPTGRRCAQLGRAVRRAIEAMPDKLDVALIGSGGLWHMPMFPQATLDGGFDRAIIAALVRGDCDGMAEVFDGYSPPADPLNLRRYSGGTDMVLGYGGGTGETRNWIAVAAAMEGRPGTIVDYVPVYASPVGLAFAMWSLS